MGISLFPVLYFFSFLYYTDPGAVALVLAMYLAALHNYNKLAGFLGFLSILFRQNSVIWVVCIAGFKAVDYLKVIIDLDEKIKPSSNVKDDVSRYVSVLYSYRCISYYCIIVIFLISNDTSI